MLQKIIYTIFVINTIISFSDGIPLSEFNETNLLLSMSTQLTDLRSQQEHQKQLIDGVIKTLDITNRQDELLGELVKAADIQLLKAELERQKRDELKKNLIITSLKADREILKADLERQKKLLDGHEESLDRLVNKSDIRILKEEIERQKVDGVVKATEINSLRADLERIEKDEIKKESNIKSLKSELELQRKMINAQRMLFNGLVKRSDIQTLEEKLERHEADGISKATDIKSNKAKLKQQGELISILENKSFRSCTEAKTSGIINTLVFSLNVKSFKVFCDAETHGGGWTTILRRLDGSVDFYRNWNEYKNGFGNLRGEFFLGLEKIHSLTSDRSQELLVILEDFEGNERFETYDEFAIGDENQKYILHTLGKANGTAGDSFSIHRGMKFSTFDNDNDTDSKENCAEYFTGAWWYKACHNSNLMGRYDNKSPGKGVLWLEFGGRENYLKKAVMLIRPKK